MSTFEQSEILDFPDVWFLGLEAKKIEGAPGAPQNNGELKATPKEKRIKYSSGKIFEKQVNKQTALEISSCLIYSIGNR